MIEEAFHAVLTAIRTKCQQAHWFGPDALKPTLEHSLPPDDPFIDEYAEESLTLDHPERFGFVYAPATEEQVQATEARLGFPLPSVFRCLLQHLANGGFGPGTGLPGVKGGYPGAYQQHDGSVWAYVAPPNTFSYITFQEQVAQSLAKGYRAGMLVPSGAGLEHVLPLVDLGCCQWINGDSQGRLFLTAPTEHDTFSLLSQLPWNLEEWLWR